MHGESYRHWRLALDQSRIAWLYFNKAGSGPNVLSSEVLLELERVLTEAAAQSPLGLALVSDKASGFIAGADVQEIARIEDQQQALALIQTGHRVLARLEGLACPTVAGIRGFCLGGGLELALACTYRVAVDEPATRLGLPEVLLGIHPGFGGTMRSVRLLGAPAAMDLMLSGRTVDARGAERLGLVDRSVPERHLESAILAHLGRPPALRRAPFIGRVAGSAPLRPWVARYLRRQVGQRARPEHYPAPYALIDLWERHGQDPQRMLGEEAQSVARLATQPSTRNLIRVFFLQERLKSLGKQQALTQPRVHVIGAGTMGGDIAAWCALRGLEVTLEDREPRFIAPAIKRAEQLFTKRIRDRRLRQRAYDRLVPDQGGLGVARADLVIEAIVEDAAIKQALYRKIEARMKPAAILATNTSSIPIETLAQALARPERLLGVHFFNPVARMQLVEVIPGPATDGETLHKAMALVRLIDRLPLQVKSAPGFLVNRVLMPYLMEAITLLSEGVQAERIDETALAFGMPMGPLELADTVGLDVCLSVGRILSQHLGGDMPELLQEKVGRGQLGRKSGSGFYVYKKGQPQRRGLAGAVTDGDLSDRLILRLLNEAVSCLREGVVADADLLDAGMVFGTGFAPFRGGPMHYAKTRGVVEVSARLQAFARNLGDRFIPDAGWAGIPPAG